MRDKIWKKWKYAENDNKYSSHDNHLEDLKVGEGEMHRFLPEKSEVKTSSQEVDAAETNGEEEEFDIIWRHKEASRATKQKCTNLEGSTRPKEKSNSLFGL
jgi:hypothetical protein